MNPFDLMTIPQAFLLRRGLVASWLALGLGAVSVMAQPVFVEVRPFFDTDTLLEPGGTPLTPPLDANRDRMDGQTLPAAYSDTGAWSTVDGKGMFMFGSLKKSGLDAMALNGQTLNVPPGKYGSMDLALLSAPDG